jgi:DNA adenine methylase
MGSKNRLSKDILPIILKDRKIEQYYVEPFAGGMNLIDKVSGNRIANDLNYYLIEMWNGLQNNYNRPYEITREMYSLARTDYNNNTNENYSDFLIGWIGWMGSYNGRFFDGGYSGHSVGNTKRNYIAEQIRNTEKQIEFLKDVRLHSTSYDALTLPSNSLIYCDIPYKGTKQYTTSKSFNHDNFWQWCRDKTTEGHKVFVSEYNSPKDFKCVWEKQVTNSMNQKKTHKPTERLFTYE